MKYATVEIDGECAIATVEGEQVNLLAFDGDMRAFIEAGAPDVSVSRSAPLTEVKLCAPVGNPSKVLAVGRNYAEHVEEEGADLPAEPLIFVKLPSAIIGPGDVITWSKTITGQVDWECELVVVIGKPARNVSQGDALDFVFGYTCGNDVSARDLQFGDGQWVRGKGLETFCPVGPWIVTDIENPNDLSVATYVNGEQMQGSSTDKMIFDAPFLVSYMSRMFTLYPGDMIFSGTPSGVGFARKPPQFLGDGDVVRVEVEGVGALENTCKVV